MDHNLLRMECLDAWVAERLAHALREAAVDCEDLAERVGIPVAQLWDRLELRDSFRLDELVCIAAAIGLEPAALIPPVEL